MKFQLGGRGGGLPAPPPLGHVYAPREENKKGARKFSTRFLAFSNVDIKKVSVGMGRYQKSTKTNKNWEFQNEALPPNKAFQNLNFLTFQAGHMKFLR